MTDCHHGSGGSSVESALGNAASSRTAADVAKGASPHDRLGKVWLKRSLSVFGMVVAVLVLTELGLRLFAPIYFASDLEDYVYDQELGLRLKPNLNVAREKDFLFEMRTNAIGTVNYENDPASYDSLVFALGDSHTMGIGVPSDASFPFLTSLILNRDREGLYDKRYGVANLAMAAFGGEQSLICLKRFSGELGKPKYVLYLGDDSDAADDALFKSGYRHRHKVEGSPRWGVTVKPIRWVLETQLGRRVKKALNRPEKPSVDMADSCRSGEERCTAEREEDVLNRIAQTCHELGATLIVSWSGPGRSYRWAKDWSERSGVAFADWLPAMQSVQRAIPDLPADNSHSAGHPRTWVNLMVAESFAKEIHAHKSDE